MTKSGKQSTLALEGGARIASAGLALGLLALLAVAVWLKPDPRGLGTHQQFGLPPCTFRVLFGRPCPTCGMTTAWANVVRGQLFGALRANIGGTVLALLAVASVPWLAVSTIRGRWFFWAPNGTVVAWGGTAIALVTMIEWAARLAAG